ncbi:hypothetical protein H2203_007525 [Taxawa tesnikishii (nom. ined.)]|nr:hypothetical protein H2203_007525 [Dothideales sp. JES 119]
MVLRTYSGRKRKLLQEDDDALKRRRVFDDDESNRENDLSTLSSSEPPSSDQLLFSDAPAPITTPPSSPPPLVGRSQSPIPNKEEQTCASSKSRNALADVSSNVRPILQQPVQKSPKTKKRLVQTQIHLGGPVQKTCKTCGMEYIPSSSEDAALHKKFHAQNLHGVDLGKPFIKSSTVQALWRGRGVDAIVCISAQSTSNARKKARTVLDVVQSELGAVDIPDDSLWGLCDEQDPVSCEGKEPEAKDGPQDCRHKVYLYLRGPRCVGLCLAERISKAYKTIEQESSTATNHEDQASLISPGESASASDYRRASGSPIAIADDADPALLGISRIWVSNSCRKQGIASSLLDCVQKTFRHGVVMPKDLIAFSQPTESGASLARKWFGNRNGWRVYLD